MLGFFDKLSFDVKIRLFHSYCTSYYGCELWNLCSNQLSEFCTKWQRCVRRVLNLPIQTHCYLLPMLCHCLPVFDEICKRSMNFVRSCLSHQSSVVQSVAWYGVMYGRMPCQSTSHNVNISSSSWSSPAWRGRSIAFNRSQ